jgi:hypothetical protein
VEGERKGGGEREGVEFSFSEEQGVGRRTHACMHAGLDRSTPNPFYSVCLVTFVDRSSSEQRLGSLLYLLGSIIIGCALMADE